MTKHVLSKKGKENCVNNFSFNELWISVTTFEIFNGKGTWLKFKLNLIWAWNCQTKMSKRRHLRLHVVSRNEHYTCCCIQLSDPFIIFHKFWSGIWDRIRISDSIGAFSLGMKPSAGPRLHNWTRNHDQSGGTFMDSQRFTTSTNLWMNFSSHFAARIFRLARICFHSVISRCTFTSFLTTRRSQAKESEHLRRRKQTNVKEKTADSLIKLNRWKDSREIRKHLQQPSK